MKILLSSLLLFGLMVSAVAQDEKISQMPAGGPAQAGDLLPIARSGANYSLTAAQIAALGSFFSALTPGVNTQASVWNVSPATAVGGSTANFSIVGYASDTNTAPLLAVSGGSSSSQPIVQFTDQGNNAYSINTISAGGAQQQHVWGVCPATPSTSDVSRGVTCANSATATLHRYFAGSASYTGKVLQVETESAAGSGFELFSARVGCASDGSCASGTEVFNVLGNGNVTTTAILPTTLYSAAGTPLPSCASGINGEQAMVSDATSPTYMGTYSSGGAIVAAVVCSYNGSAYAWKTH